MTHQDYFNLCVDNSNGRVHEVQLINMLASIAESLAAIADHIEKEDAEKMKIMIDGKEIKNDVQV